MKNLFYLGLFAIVLVSCQGDPQEKAEKNAEHYSDVAHSEAAAAQSELQQSQENANSAVIHATQAEMNAALSKVSVPELESVQASELAKKIGNDGIDYVNANDYKQASKYGERFRDNLQKLNKLEEKGTITEGDANKVRQYVTDLTRAISIEVNVVEIEPAP